MTTEHLRWIVDSCTDYGALLFLWVGQFGTQPVLMPGHVYYWWIESPEDIEHGARATSIH